MPPDTLEVGSGLSILCEGVAVWTPLLSILHPELVVLLEMLPSMMNLRRWLRLPSSSFSCLCFKTQLSSVHKQFREELTFEGDKLWCREEALALREYFSSSTLIFIKIILFPHNS